MENFTTYRNLYRDLKKSAYPEIDDLPLMNGPGPVLTILAVYWAFVLRVGPAFMRKRQPYRLTMVMLAYNIVQVAISAYLVQTILINLFFKYGVAPKTCHLSNEDSRKEIILPIWLYLCAKVTELADTVFFILRKKDNQVSFLHVYHHSIMVFGTWGVLKYWTTQAIMFVGFLNSLVHVLMYSYYGLAGLGPQVAKYLTWKKYITKLQLAQFITIIIHYWHAIRVSECPQDSSFNTFVICNTSFFLLLFSNFYRKSYMKKKD